MVSSFSALILLPDFNSSVILICGNGFAGITGNAGGRWIHSFFIIGGGGGGQLTEDGGQQAAAGPECGEQHRSLEVILLSEAEILQIKETWIHSVP